LSKAKENPDASELREAIADIFSSFGGKEYEPITKGKAFDVSKEYKTIAGIDPGYKTGGVALYNPVMDWYEVHDLPTYESGGVDLVALADILNSDNVRYVYIEKQQAMPKQGISSTFNLGYAFGQIVGMMQLWEQVSYSLVTPAKWKRELGVPRGKDGARIMAQREFPKVAKQLTRKKDEHRAEALLIAKYGRNYEWF
jgi:crossover junction endodeoxyribonuclease RuvC